MSSTENYKIIANESRLKAFIDWLPDLKNHETYYVCLFARAKYAQGLILSSGQTQLKRFTSSKGNLFSKIKQLECPVGSYTYKGNELPQESLALYINPNPRDLEKATKNSLIKFAQLITKPYTGYNPHSEILSEIQVTYSRKIYMNFDFDEVDYKDVINTIKENDIMNLDAITISKTRGGFHLLANIEKIHDKYRKSWYVGMTKIPGCDKKSGSNDGLLPVPGCVQGGFSPYIFPALSPELMDTSEGM